MQIYNPRQYDFHAIRPAMQGYVDRKILAGVSTAILHENHLVYHDCVAGPIRNSKLP